MRKIDSFLIQGGPGVGKSRFQKDLIRKHYPERHFLYLGFTTTHLKHRDQQFFTEENTLTIHSACFRPLREHGILPSKFKFAMKLPLTPLDLELLQDDNDGKLDYAELLSSFHNDLDDSQICDSYGNIELVAVDEVQDLSQPLMEVVERFRSIYNCPVIMAGDDFQRIYAFSKASSDPGKDNILEIAKQLSITPKVITLNENKRNPEYADFLNGYYRKNFPEISPDYLYQTGSNSVKPDIYFFDNPVHEREYILRAVEEMGGNITILARAKDYLSWLHLPDWIPRSTIHAFKGAESDIIILTGFSAISAMDTEELKVWGVAISRARKKLVITTSFPKETVLQHFGSDTLQVFDYTNRKRNPYRRLPALSSPGFHGCIQFNKSTIDSIAWQLSENAVPFWPYIKHNAPIQKTIGRTCLAATSSDGIPYMISRYHRRNFTGHYRFHFLDLNRLRNSGYDDFQILIYVRNIILDYFDGRIEDTSLELTRMDLSKGLRFRTKRERAAFALGLLRKIGLTNPPTLLKHIPGIDGQEAIYEKVEFTEERFASMEYTAYFNFRKKRSGEYPLTFVFYNPSRKNNANAFPGGDNHFYAKAEFRLTTRDMVRQKRFFGTDNSFTAIARHVKGNRGDWYRHMTTSYFGFDPFTKEGRGKE